MKRFKFTALMAVLFSISIAVTGCGGGSEDPANVGPGTPGFGGGIIPGVGATPVPGGGMQISFSASGAYNSGVMMTAGYVSGTTYSGSFSYGNASWYFSNNTPRMNPCTYSYITMPQVLPTSSGVPVGQAGTTTYTGTSLMEPGASVTVVATTPQCSLSNIVGVLTLPPAFLQRNPQAFPQGAATPIVGLAFDFPITTSQYQPGTYKINGGVLIYTSGSQGGYHGAFLAL